MAKQVYSDVTSTSINMISEGTSIKGDISAKGNTRIDGELVGNITAEEKLVIGPKGKVEGEIRCSSIEVSGLIKGKVTAKELLILKASSKIEGDIIAGKLSVEPGAVFTGSCTMKASQTTDEPVKTK